MHISPISPYKKHARNVPMQDRKHKKLRRATPADYCLNPQNLKMVLNFQSTEMKTEMDIQFKILSRYDKPFETILIT